MLHEKTIATAAESFCIQIEERNYTLIEVKELAYSAYLRGAVKAFELVTKTDTIVKDAREAYRRIKSHEHSAEDPGNLIANLSKYFDLTGGILALNDLE